MSFKISPGKTLESKERRSFRRFPTASRKKIKIHLMNPPLGFEKDLEGSLLNISKGGLCLSLKAPLTPKQVAIISLPFLHGKTEVPTLGEIHWVSKNSGGDKNNVVGIRFLL